MNALTPERTYYPALDGLRGVAILLVIFLHNFNFTNYFFFGWLGVDLFFVLSGFLITDILLRTLETKNFLRNFYMRRFLRIFPLYFVAVSFCLFVIPLINKSVHINYYINNQLWIWTFTQNWLYIFKSPEGTPVLLHFWSLAVEEQFYLIWPLIIMLVKKPKPLLWISFILLLGVMVTRVLLWRFNIEDLAYDSLYTFTRIDGICVGSMIALLIRVNPFFLKKYNTLIVFILAGINFIFYFLNLNAAVRLPYLAFAGYTTFAILFGILIHEAVTGRSKIIKVIFENRLLRFFGKISYGFYVYHWPVYVLLFPYWDQVFASELNLSPAMAKTASAIMVTLISVLVSYLSYHYFERFFLRLKKNYS